MGSAGLPHRPRDSGSREIRGVISSGIHSLAILHRLSVLAVQEHWAVIAGVELRSVKVLTPVRPGDTLRGSVHIVPVTSDHRRDPGLVSKMRAVGLRGYRCFRPVSDVLVRARLPAAGSATNWVAVL